MFDNLAYLGLWDREKPGQLNIYVWVYGNSNELVSFEVKGKGHGEIDILFLII
jgi:hypothetical protein